MKAMERLFEYFRGLSAVDHKGRYRVTGGIYHKQRVNQVERVGVR